MGVPAIKPALPGSEWLREHFGLDGTGRVVRKKRTHPYYTWPGQIVNGTKANGATVIKIKGRQVPLHRVVSILKETK